MSAPTHERRVRWDERLARRGGALELLRAPAWLFGRIGRLRAGLYDAGWLRSAHVDVPVISVGNLTVGGTGKTPLVAYLARELARRGKRVGLLSRGYKNHGEHANDEARVLAALLPGVPHVQDPDRVRGAHDLQNRGVDVIVLDDGFQHRRLARDLDIVLIDATRPWGLPASSPESPPLRALLPRGLLREPPAALARADLIVLTHVEALEAPALAVLQAELEFEAPGKPIVLASHEPVGLRVHDSNLASDGERVIEGLAYLRDREIDLVSGIGNPGAFEAMVRALGANVCSHRRFPDHHDYTLADVRDFGQRPLVTTAKDAVKLAPLGISCVVVDIDLQLGDGAAVLAAQLDALPESKHQRQRRSLHEGLHG